MQSLSTTEAPCAPKQIFGQAKDLVISVVVAIRNDGDRLATLIDEISGVLTGAFKNHELIVVVVDGATDGSIKVARRKAESTRNLRVLVLSRRYGTQVALTAGLDHAVGDYVVLMAPEFNSPPAAVTQLVAHALKGTSKNSPFSGVVDLESG